MHFPATLTPAAFEEHVRRWLEGAGASLDDFSVQRLETLEGSGGEYEMDVVARMTVFGGAEIIILIECKHHRNPIKREVLNALESKLRDIKAHKAMVFSTVRFQSGALDFARAHRIATLLVSDEGATYETRSRDSRPTPTPNRAVAWVCEQTPQGESYSRIDLDRSQKLRSWLKYVGD